MPVNRQDKFLSSLSNCTKWKLQSAFVEEGDREVAKDLTVIESSNHPLVRETVYTPVYILYLEPVLGWHRALGPIIHY